MDFERLAAALGGEVTWTERGKLREATCFVVRLPGRPELQAYPELREGECVGAVFVAQRPDARELPRIVLRREEPLDRGGKALGINREVQLGEPAFDAAIYIETEAPEAAVRRALASPVAREAAAALVRGPAGEVELGEGRVALRLDAAALAAEPAALLGVLERVADLGGALAVPGDMPSRAELVQRRSVGHIFVVAFAWLVTLVLAVMLRPPVVLTWGAIAGALGLGLGLWLLVCGGLALVLRGGADSMRWVLLSAGAFLMTTPFAGMKLALLANAGLDPGPEAALRRPVELVDASETRLLLDVSGLVEGEPVTRLTVLKHTVVGTLPPKPGSLTLVLRPGAFGWAWLVEVRP